MNGNLRERAAVAAIPVIQRLLDEIHGIITIQVNTADGYVVADHLADGIHGRKLAAMSSSLVALTESLSNEMQLGQLRNLVVEATDGTAVARRISDDLLLLATVQSGTQLGYVLNGTKSAAEAIKAAISD